MISRSDCISTWLMMCVCTNKHKHFIAHEDSGDNASVLPFRVERKDDLFIHFLFVYFVTMAGGVDFNAPSLMVTLPSFTAMACVDIATVVDLFLENDETFTVSLSSSDPAQGVVFGAPSDVTVTILDGEGNELMYIYMNVRMHKSVVCDCMHECETVNVSVWIERQYVSMNFKAGV